MIKIIKEGNPKRKIKTIYTITCKKCGCVFECEVEDFDSLTKGLDGWDVVCCPCCNEPFEVDRGSITSRQEEIE